MHSSPDQIIEPRRHGDARGLRWDDSKAGIAWPLPIAVQPLLSAKDDRLPGLRAFASPFGYYGAPLDLAA